jgi:hypothetical protein
MLRPVITVAAALLIGAGLAGPLAASAICDQLTFELAGSRQAPDANAEARKFERAIKAQKASLRLLDTAMRRNGCSNGSMIVVDSAEVVECGHFEAKQARMERNLEILEDKRISLLSEDRSDVDREKLLRALEENRCNEAPQLVSAPDDGYGEPLVHDDPNGFETIRVPQADPDYADQQFVDLGGSSMNGSFRTMCVRACDGAYFPVSSHASTLDFRRDAQVCSMMCPGMETELFYNSLSQESTDMRSTVNGQAYQDLPNAYRFRTEKADDKGQCGCNFSLFYKEMMKRQAFVKDPGSQPEQQSAIVWIKPELRGGLANPKQVPASKPKVAEREYRPTDKIRVIGPQFLPDDGALDFRHPAGSANAEVE